MGDDLRMVLVRIPLLVLAACACAWFGLGAVQAHDIGRASSIVAGTGRLAPARAAQARSLLSSAAMLNPDRSIDLLRAQLALRQGRRPVAIAILRRTVADEPLNLNAWVALAKTALGHDTTLLDLAVVHLAKLDPKLK
jgi:hypothetical protein